MGLGPGLAPLTGSRNAFEFKVPSNVRLASVNVGLWGGTGEVSIGNVALKVIVAKPRSGGGQSK